MLKAADGVKPEPVCQYEIRREKTPGQSDPVHHHVCGVDDRNHRRNLLADGIKHESADKGRCRLAVYADHGGGVSGAGHLWKCVQYLCQPVQGKG